MIGVKSNKDISFFKSTKENYYQGLTEYVKNYIDMAFASMVRCMREYIPKACGNFLIKSLKSNMRFYLLKYISVNPEFAQGLEEDQEVTQMRQYYISSKKKLKKLFKNIGFDDQLMKIIKGANVNKTIDETLKAQGINKIEPEKTNLAAKKDKPVSAKNLFGQFPEGKPDFNSGQNDKNNDKKKNNLFGNNPQGQPTFEKSKKTRKK